MNGTLVGQTVTVNDKTGSHPRKVTAIVIERGTAHYEYLDLTTNKTGTALAEVYDRMFLAPKGQIRKGQHYKGKAIRHSQLKGVI